MHTPSDHDRDTRLMQAGRLLAADPVLADGDWDGYALVARYGDGPIDRRLSGFRYRDGNGYQAATPQQVDAIGSALDALREATRVDGRAPWQACVLQLRRASGRLHADFEYDDPARWDITPATLDAVAERARPND